MREYVLSGRGTGMRQDLSWQERAACAGSDDPEAFFLKGTPRESAAERHRARMAKDLCEHACPVSEDCAIFALEHNERGTWGATRERDRNQIKKQLKRKAG